MTASDLSVALPFAEIDRLMREGNNEEARDVLALVHTLQHERPGYYTDALFLAEDGLPQLGYDARGRPFLYGYPFETFRNGVSEAVVAVELREEPDRALAQRQLDVLEDAVSACYYRFCVHERFLPGVCFAAVHVLSHLAERSQELATFAPINEDYQRRIEAV